MSVEPRERGWDPAVWRGALALVVELDDVGLSLDSRGAGNQAVSESTSLSPSSAGTVPIRDS